MSFTRYLLLVCVTGFAGLLVLPALNLRLDTARVLRGDFKHAYDLRTPNVAFLKVSYMIHHKEKFDSVVFGSSRVNIGIPIEVLGENWYKLDSDGGLLDEHLSNLKALLQGGVPLKNVVVAIDDFSLYLNRENDSDYFFRLYPNQGTLQSWVDFYKFYLFKFPQDWELKALMKKMVIVPDQRIVGMRGGEPLNFQVRSREKHVEFVKAAEFNETHSLKPPNYEETVRIITEMRNLCRERGINFQFFFNPLQYKELMARSISHQEKFKRELIMVSDFYDFTDLGFLSKNFEYWHDNSHFTPYIGRFVMERVVKNVKSPFGELVTQANIDRHLRGVRLDIAKTLPAILAQDNQLLIHEDHFQERSFISPKVEEVSGSFEISGLPLTGPSLVTATVKAEGVGRVQVKCGRDMGDSPIRKGVQHLTIDGGSCGGRLKLSVAGAKYEFSEWRAFTYKMKTEVQ